MAKPVLAIPESVTQPDVVGSEVLRLLRARWSRDHIRTLSSAWSSWEAFADHHNLDPEVPTDTALVAFVQGRVLAGTGWVAVNRTLMSVRLAMGGSTRLDEAGVVTIAAQRHLTDLHDAGMFDPCWQAPVLPLGHIVAMVEHAGSVRDAFVVALTYVAGLRPTEWTAIDVEHLQVNARGLVMMLPETKTGRWQKVRITPLPQTPLDVSALATAWLAVRGTAPGPLITDKDWERLSASQMKKLLRRAAAAAGVIAFSPYSLRRSMAVHADLLGVVGTVIRARLRHTPNSETYRRYIEPLMALVDRDATIERYLSLAQPVGPVSMKELDSGHPVCAPRWGFVSGTVPELLAGINMAGLRVPCALATVSRSTMTAGQAAYRRWASWANKEGVDPADPGISALPRWVLHRLGQVDPVTVETELAAVRIGWIDATGVDKIPGWDIARIAAHSAAEKAISARPPRYICRPATSADVAAVCAAVTADVPGSSLQWAVAVLAASTRAESQVEVVGGDTTFVAVRVDRRCTVRLTAAAHGLICPVTAGLVAAGRGPVQTVGAASWEAVLLAGQERTAALRDRVAVTLLAGSGARPSDLARGRNSGVREMPGGLAVLLAASKGQRPGRLGRGRLIWAPLRDGTADPVAAWRDWAAWWPFTHEGPLLPCTVKVRPAPADTGMTSKTVSKLVIRALDTSGVEGMSAYGFRYRRAQEMHDGGETDETIAEALGHDDLTTTRGYIQDFDPFSDGLDVGFAKEAL